MATPNAYSTPFELVCAKCNTVGSVGALIDGGTIDCVVYNDKCAYEYKHCLNAIIQIIDKSTVQCTIRAPILQDVLPSLTQLAYETYILKKNKRLMHNRKKP